MSYEMICGQSKIALNELKEKDKMRIKYYWNKNTYDWNKTGWNCWEWSEYYILTEYREAWQFLNRLEIGEVVQYQIEI